MYISPEEEKKSIVFGKKFSILIYNTLRKSIIDERSNFTSFLNNYKQVKHWIISSDYCIGDKNKKNSTMAFSIMPEIEQLSNIKKKIKLFAPIDIKKSRHISEDFIHFMRSGYIFNVVLIIKDIKNILNSRESIFLTLKYTKEYTESLKNDNSKQTRDLIKKLDMLMDKVRSPSFNCKIFRHSIVLSIIYSFIAACIAEHTKSDKIIIYPDRDSMTESNRGFAFDFMKLNYHGLSSLYNAPEPELIIHEQENDNLWFDELIRIPDYLAGTFADWDRENNRCREKFLPMIEDFAADNNFLHLFEFGAYREGNMDKFHNIIVEIKKPSPKQVASS